MTAATPIDRAGRSRRAILRFVIAAIVMLSADLASKYAAFEHVAGEPVVFERNEDGSLDARIAPHERSVVVPNVLALHLTINRGAVFGIGQGKRWIFIAFSVVAGIVIPWIFARTRSGQWFVQLALAAVLAGAIGNLYDRVVYAGVRDMLLLFPGIHLPFGLAWPGSGGQQTELYPWIFNVADVFLVVGLGILMVVIYRAEDEPTTGSEPPPDTTTPS